jgi:hypothetical protein
MSLVSFGQPDDGVIQMAYVVEDIQHAMREWATRLKVGPWFLLEGFRGLEPMYRGQESGAEIALAMSFAGHMNVELIQQVNTAPSVYREVIEKRGYGFHHFGVATRNFEQEVGRYRAAEAELAFFLRVPSGGRVAYMDTTATLPGMTEVIEFGPGFEPTLNRFYRASIGWDGKDPVRPFLE